MTISNEFNFSKEWEAIQREVKSQVAIKRKELLKPIRDKYKQELKEVAHLWCGTPATKIKLAMKLGIESAQWEINIFHYELLYIRIKELASRSLSPFGDKDVYNILFTKSDQSNKAKHFILCWIALAKDDWDKLKEINAETGTVKALNEIVENVGVTFTSTTNWIKW